MPLWNHTDNSVSILAEFQRLYALCLSIVWLSPGVIFSVHCSLLRWMDFLNKTRTALKTTNLKVESICHWSSQHFAFILNTNMSRFINIFTWTSILNISYTYFIQLTCISIFKIDPSTADMIITSFCKYVHNTSFYLRHNIFSGNPNTITGKGSARRVGWGQLWFSTGETRYNEILGTRKFCLWYQIYILLYQLSINNTKQRKLLHWDRRKQFVLSDILLYQISLYEFRL